MKLFTLTLFCVINVIHTKLTTNFNAENNNIQDDPGLPLILTPLLEANRTEAALRAAKNYFNGFKNIKSYSGYFTVNKQFNSNIFFTFFPSENDYKNDPVIIWLQGAFSVTSLIGLFAENGPYKAKSQKGLELRPYAWTKMNSVIYIDSPVGSGFSFTTNGYAKNQTQIVNELYNGLEQFFIMFPELKRNDFFLFGESYAAKTIVTLSHIIHEKNANNPSINLKGLAIQNGFIDPINQIQYSQYLYQIGLIDFNQITIFQQYEQDILNALKNQNYTQAYRIYNDLINGNLQNNSTLFKNITDFTNVYNYLYINENNLELKYAMKYMQRDDVRAALHVGNATLHLDNTVQENLENDVMQSVAPLLSDLLNNYRVLIYNGQLDIIFAYPLVINSLQNLQFNGNDEYKKAQRHIWNVDQYLAGYVKQAGNLTEILVRNAGHMICADQTQWCYDMVMKFTRNQPFY